MERLNENGRFTEEAVRRIIGRILVGLDLNLISPSKGVIISLWGSEKLIDDYLICGLHRIPWRLSIIKGLYIGISNPITSCTVPRTLLWKMSY